MFPIFCHGLKPFYDMILILTTWEHKNEQKKTNNKSQLLI